MIARTGQRARCDLKEPFRPRDRAIGVELLGSDEVRNLGMFRRRLEILAHRHEIDVGAAHVVHHLMNFQPLFAEAQHNARLREDERIVGFHLLQ